MGEMKEWVKRWEDICWDMIKTGVVVRDWLIDGERTWLVSLSLELLVDKLKKFYDEFKDEFGGDK
ncbi:MAG: hypothetical protein DRP12_03335 [Candidatus Aenigmatarchaeota archaeon]|nr:MAG: hypothetical protein DRP12_03335 [Candidatus Aenigmarchaeota archaeon]